MSRMIRILTALIFVLSAGVVASAETLLMPKRDGRMGASLVVWGVTTQANGTPFSIDYGDGSADTVGVVTDRSYIAFNHIYATQGIFTVTLTVGVESTTVDVQIFDPAALPGGVAGENNRALGVNMAIQDGLRYLWTAQANRASGFPAATTTHWGGNWSVSHAGLVTLAYENHGYKLANDGSAPTGIYEKYVVRRGLNYVISALGTITIASQPSGLAGQPVRNPCVGTGIEASPCTGLRSAFQHWPGSPETGHESYQTGVSILPLAASGALNRVNTEVAGYTNGKTYGEILQRATNALAWGQIDHNASNGRGGWYYGFNASSSDGSTLGWDVLAMLDAAAAGATVPAWVSTEFVFALAGGLNNDGTLDYQSNGNAAANGNVGPAKNGIGLQGLFLIGETVGARVNAVRNTVDSWWGGLAGTGGNSWGCAANQNKGCGYTMFNNFKGLKLQGITTLPNVSIPSGGGIPTSRADDDWYKDYQDWLVVNQQAPTTSGGGHWSLMGFSCCDNSVPLTAAIAELILSPVALVLPDPDKFASVGLSPATASGLEMTSHTVTAHTESTNGAPVAGATVTFTVISGPNVGVTGTGVTNAAGNATFTYTDAGPEGTVGTDRIRASIGTLTSNTVEMTWTPLNQAPAATDNTYTTPEDAALSGNVITDAPADTDADGDTLTASLVSGPSNGLLVFNPDGSFTYTPNANYCGSDSFSYKVNDGTVDSNVAIVNIGISCVNDAPTADDDSFTTAEDSAVSGSVATNDTSVDVEGSALTFTKTSDPANGTVAFNADGTFTYTPNANFCGTDSFTYSISDGTDSDAATVTIDVTCVNDAPVANDDSNSTNEDTPVGGSVATNDSDVDSTLSYSVLAGPSNGTVSMNPDGTYLYTPSANFCGTDSFTYTATDGTLSDTATVTITVNCVNDAPFCAAAAPSVSLLWPPNHKLVDVSVLGVTDPVEGTDTTITITSIRQDEPTNTQGDGNTPIDGYGVGSATAQVRAERSGNPKVPGDGRMYHIFFTGTDAGGATCTGVVKVGVPHDQGNGNTVIDGGPIYSSTGS